MLNCARSVVLSCMLALSRLAVADTRLGDSCDLDVLGVADKHRFLGFDHDLRVALDHADAAALAALVQFPLRLNYADGSRLSLDNPAALQRQFAQVFPPALRKAVLDQKVDGLFCKPDGGVMYGNGEIWADQLGAGGSVQFRIVSVNVPEGQRSGTEKTRAAGPVQLTCASKNFHIVIDIAGNEAVRYRAWNTPRSTTEKPDIELLGSAGGEGTGSCFHRIWRFKNGNTDYVISEAACGDGGTPDHALAELEVLIGGKSQLTSWCF